MCIDQSFRAQIDVVGFYLITTFLKAFFLKVTTLLRDKTVRLTFFCDMLFVVLKATKQNFSKRNLKLKFNFRHAIWSNSRDFLKFIYLKRKLVFLFIKLVRFLWCQQITLWKSHSRKTVCYNWYRFLSRCDSFIKNHDIIAPCVQIWEIPFILQI